MNAGFSNLSALKAWLLAPSLLESTEYDAQILGIGRGAAALLENYCGRKFARAVGDVFEIAGDREHLNLPRYPIETITTIEQSTSPLADPEVWTVVTGAIQRQALDRGLIYFGRPLYPYRERIRITYTGGFWWNQQEADYEAPDVITEMDPDLSLMPEGATALPDDLLLGWQLQCEHIWKQRDKLGIQLAKDQEDTSPGVEAIQLIPIVQMLVQPFVRYSLT